MDSQTLYEEYNSIVPKYKRAKKNVKDALEEFLKESDISYVNIESRIKEFDSFYEKISRKKYENPFEENEDFCGIRIILYFQDDIEKVCNIIKKHFEIKDYENKSEKLEDNEIGYHSNHFIIKIKDSWCVTPNYKNLENIKIELQIRTVLMHTWAAIEHKLGYKNNQELPKTLRRKLYLMSAQLENADMQFQEIKNSAETFQYNTIKESREKGKFIGEKLNIDTLQALLEYYFPDYKNENIHLVKNILDHFIEKNIDIKKIASLAASIQPYVETINELIRKKEVNFKSSRANLMLYALEIFDNSYKVSENQGRNKIINKVKKLIN